MDKAPDFGSGDCRFESCHGRIFCHDKTLIFCFIHIGNIQFITRSMVKLCILSPEALLYSLMFCPFDHVEQCGTMWNNVEQSKEIKPLLKENQFMTALLCFLAFSP